MMLKKGMVLGLGLAGTLLALPSWALDVGALRQAYESGRAQHAYDLALIDLEEGEGDPAFDFYYGVAAIDSGHLNEGVFALERVLLVQPGHLRARLELARGYFLLREDSRAQQEFKAVLEQNPSANVQANVQRFMDAIRLREGRYRPTSNVFAEAGFGHDTNVSSSTEGDVVLFNFLTGNFSEESDQFIYARGGASYNKPFSPGRSFFSNVDVQSRHNLHDDDFDTSYINGVAGLSVLQGADRYRVSLQGQKYHVGESNLNDFLFSDEDTFRQMVAVNGEWQRTVSRVTQVSLFGQVANLKYPGADIRNSMLYTLGAGATHVVSNDEAWVKRYKPVIFGSVWAGMEHSDDRSDAAQSLADREFAGMRGGIRIIPMPRLSLDASVTYQWAEYNKASTIVFNSSGAVTREDDFFLVSVGAKYLLTDAVVVGGEVSYTSNDSTVGLNDFDRTQARGYVRYNFN
ncbi:MAG: porin family protein [Immundisolibacteraceae bacterium]|nr:porin family protein [Immundisolibacteraceae bacterium]